MRLLFILHPGRQEVLYKVVKEGSSAYAWWCSVSLSMCTKGPLGEFVFLYLCLSGDFFVANTHFITLTLIKNTWPYSRGQSVHKSAQRSVEHSPSKALRLLLLRSQRPGLCLFNCGAALGGVTAARGAVGAHPSVNASHHGPLLVHIHTHTHPAPHPAEFKALLGVIIILKAINVIRDERTFLDALCLSGFT